MRCVSASPHPTPICSPSPPLCLSFSFYGNPGKDTACSLKVSFHGFQRKTSQELRKKKIIHRVKMGRVLPRLGRGLEKSDRQEGLGPWPSLCSSKKTLSAGRGQGVKAAGSWP